MANGAIPAGFHHLVVWGAHTACLHVADHNEAPLRLYGRSLGQPGRGPVEVWRFWA